MKRYTQIIGIILLFALSYSYLTVNGSMIINERPYVYRVLLPFLSWLPSEIFKINSDIIIRILIAIFTIGLWLSSRLLYQSIYSNDYRCELFAIILVSISFVISIFPIHSYDIPTVCLFTFALFLIYSRQLNIYIFIYPFIVMQRETAFVLIIMFFLYFYKFMEKKLFIIYIAIQISIYIVIQIFIHYYYQSYPGSIGTFGLFFRLYGQMKYDVFIVHFTLFLIMFAWLHSIWHNLSYFLKIGVISIFIPISMLYIFLGSPFEFRVFLETLPIIVLISFSDNGKIMEIEKY